MVRCLRCQPERPSKKCDVRQFVQWRVIILRHGCSCSDARILWTFSKISEALGITENQVNLILKRWRARGFEIRDMRHHRQAFLPKKMSRVKLNKLLSPPELNRMRGMSLRERVDDIRRNYAVRLTHNTLHRYYRQSSVNFKTVDLHAVTKSLNADRIKVEQQAYCSLLERLQEEKVVFFLDETTTSLRKQCKKRTWTNGTDV